MMRLGSYVTLSTGLRAILKTVQFQFPYNSQQLTNGVKPTWVLPAPSTGRGTGGGATWPGHCPQPPLDHLAAATLLLPWQHGFSLAAHCFSSRVRATRCRSPFTLSSIAESSWLSPNPSAFSVCSSFAHLDCGSCPGFSSG